MHIERRRIPLKESTSMIHISVNMHEIPSIVSFIVFQTWFDPTPQFTRVPPSIDMHLRHFILRTDQMGEVCLSIPGARPSPQMLTTPVLHMPISFALPRDGRGTQGWALSVSPASMSASPSIVSVNMRAD